MLPTFSKKFNAERSAKRIANRFPGLEPAEPVKAEQPGHYMARVRVTMPGALGAEDIAEISRLALMEGAVNVVIQPTMGTGALAMDPGYLIPVPTEVDMVPISKPAPYIVSPIPAEMQAPEVYAAVSKAIAQATGEAPPLATEAGRELLQGEPVEAVEIEAGSPIPVEEFAASFPVTSSSEDDIRARREARQRREAKPQQARLFTKKAAVLNLLAKGCTNEEIRTATGWQWHTVKGFISTQRSKGRTITTEMRDGIAFYKMGG